MNKYVTAPMLLILVCSFAACGKQDSADSKKDAAAASAQPAPVVPQPPLVPQPPVPPVSPTDPNQFLLWCQGQLGTYVSAQTVCRLSIRNQYGWNLWVGSASTGMRVYVNDTVTVRASSPATAIIGSQQYSTASTFVSQSQGTLYLSGGGFNSFRVNTIEITRCVNASYQSVQCQ